MIKTFIIFLFYCTHSLRQLKNHQLIFGVINLKRKNDYTTKSGLKKQRHGANSRNSIQERVRSLTVIMIIEKIIVRKCFVSISHVIKRFYIHSSLIDHFYFGFRVLMPRLDKILNRKQFEQIRLKIRDTSYFENYVLQSPRYRR